MARTRRYNNNRQSNNRGGGNDRRQKHNAVKAVERYLNMAKDAASNGDVHLAENYYQHSDHYYRIAYADEIQRAANNDEPQTDDDDFDDDGDEQSGKDAGQDQRHQRSNRENSRDSSRGRRPQRQQSNQDDSQDTERDDDDAPKRRTRRTTTQSRSPRNDTRSDAKNDESRSERPAHGRRPKQDVGAESNSAASDSAPDIEGVAFLQKPILTTASAAPAPLNAPQPELSLTASVSEAEPAAEEPVKKKRGRPRKNPLPEDITPEEGQKPQAAAE